MKSKDRFPVQTSGCYSSIQRSYS